MPRSAAETSSIGAHRLSGLDQILGATERMAGLLSEVPHHQGDVLGLALRPVPTAVAPMFCSAMDRAASCSCATPRRSVSA